MRPAWLPAPSTGTSTSPHDVRPRSAVSRPQTPSSSSPPRDAMVQSAKRLLEDPAQPNSPENTESFVSLRDFSDSFPLVPLTIIPRLRLNDLVECETGLHDLYKSLAVDTNQDDARLGVYITRQLGLVQRHMEQARARERVFQLLSGEEPVELVAPVVRPSRSSTTLPVFLQPPTWVEPSPSVTTKPVLTTAKSASNLAPKKPESTKQLTKAKALAKATVTTAYVITTSENSLKARQKRAKKKTPQQLEEAKTKQQEREKEKRRQAAYQRLMARQALQAKKKQDAQDKKKQNEPGLSTIPQGSFEPVTELVTREPRVQDSSSEESDVSNCSDNDEADEKAILDMPVVVKLDEEEATEQPNGEESEEPTVEDQSTSSDDDDKEDERVENEALGMVTSNVGGSHNTDECSNPDLPQIDEIANYNQSNDVEKYDDTHESGNGPSGTTFQANSTGILDDIVETEEIREQRAREAIALELQRFVAERTQSALDELRSRQSEIAIRTARSHVYEATESRTSTVSFLHPSNDLLRPTTDIGTAPQVVTESPSRPRTATSGFIPPLSPTKKRPLPLAEKRSKVTTSTTTLIVPRAIGREVQDYRSYFANFFCILTSVFEQRMTFTTGSTGGTSTSNASIAPTISPTAIHGGDQALRLQLKLYQSWTTIMNDYATVFGNSATTPNGFVSTSSISSPYTAHYRINSQSRKEVSDIVVTALEKLGDWDEHPSGLGLKTTWNLLWTWSKPNVERKTLLAWQKVNHFQHAKALTRKDCLKKNIGKYQAIGGRLKAAYDIVPGSFLLPQEYVAFVQAFQERAKHVPPGKNIWIMKPVALSRGRGISLVNDLSDVVYGEQVVIQEYISNPLLLDGFKFDLRLYVLVTSFNPLEVFFYEEGFVRMCTRTYEDNDLTNLFIHLTNSSIQKDNQDAIAANPANPINAAQHDAEAGGTKMTLAYLWKRLEAMGADVATVKNDVLTVILKALVCGEDHIPYQVNSFDLYGYDILLDTNFRPWLIEINSSPSMARENDLDYQVKDALMYDTLKLVNPLHFDRSKLVDVITRRFHDAEIDKKRSHANPRHPKEVEAIAVRQLNEDLTEILRGQVPRAYGEMPEHLGNYTRIAPHTTIHNQLMKLKRSCLRLDRK